MIVFTLDLFAIGFVGHLTDSRLVGICGPFGDSKWISLQFAMLVGGFLGAIALGIYCARGLQNRPVEPSETEQ